jgi:hypothetical protein
VTLNFHQLALLALLGTAIHWIVARSSIMKWFWDLRWWSSNCNEYGERLPSGLLRQTFSDLLACTACLGWWLGLGLGVVGLRPLHLGPWWLDILGSGLAATVTVPILEGALLWGLQATRIDE